MAKIRHNNFLDTVDDVFTSAKNEGVLHLHSEDYVLNGNTIRVNGNDLKHFGTTGYLGLEQDDRLKQAAIEAISNYGTQFPLSKTYISHPLYLELERKISKMYSNYSVIITKNSTLGHIAVIPTAVRDEDAVILDHQVHWSVQNATQLLRPRGIPVEMIRHNNLEMLEEKIKKLRSHCDRIWYMADGVYSMYGDFSPVEDLMHLGKKYPQLHFYFDDVHGMSWKGNNGTGYVLAKLKGKLPKNVILVGTLSKTFGASGAVVVFSDKELQRKIKTYGGPLTFSAQLEPASVATAIASAKIHLTSEITEMQEKLQMRISYFNKLLSKSFLPLISKNESPVFYIGTGLPSTGYHYVKQLMNDGFFVNLGLFPAVPVKNTGVRITISLHNSLGDIKALFEALEYHYDKSLSATGNSMKRIERAFKLDLNFKPKPTKATNLNVIHSDRIDNIPAQNWNKVMGGNNLLDTSGLRFLEDCFQGNQEKEHNWKFHYFLINDENDQTVLATFLTESLWKDDMLSPETVSRTIEAQRKNDQYYMTSKVIGTGCLFTEGSHLYLDKEHPKKEKALKLLLLKIEELSSEVGADMIVLRDFHSKSYFGEILQQQAFIPVAMPDSCVLEKLDWKDEKEFVENLSARSRRHFRKEVKPYEDRFEIVIQETPDKQEILKYYELYKEVKMKNYGLNTFTYPLRLFKKMANHSSWEFLVLRLKHNSQVAGVMFCYKNQKKVFVPSLIGMDYDYNSEFQTYRQLLYQTIKRAKKLGFSRIDFGFSASFEKRKLGASVISKVAYIQADDNFSLEALDWLRKD